MKNTIMEIKNILEETSSRLYDTGLASWKTKAVKITEDEQKQGEKIKRI